MLPSPSLLFGLPTISACQTSGPNEGRFFGHARQGTFFFQSFVISTRTCRLFRSLFSVFLKIDSLQVYAIGLTREFAKCKTVPTKTTSAGIHSLQKTSRMTSKMTAGTQQANDNVMTRNTVFESFTFLSMLRLWSLLNIWGEHFKWARIMMYVRQVVRMASTRTMFSAKTAYFEGHTLKKGRI